MNSPTEWLANIGIEYILLASAVLLVARILLGKLNTPIAKSAAETVESFLIAVLLVFLVIRPFVVQAFFIPSGSMLPNLEIQDHILVNKFIYRFQEPRYGDIVVFKSPPSASPDRQEKDYIKRLIGKPGDVIKIYGGSVYRNGEQLEEDYLFEPGEIDYVFGPYKIPSGNLFMMGDNRNDSNDSHVWGPLDRKRIIGKAWVKFWPINRVGMIR